MGYENPRIQINQTNAEINKQVRRFNEDFNEEFDAINAQQAANIEANMEILEEQQKKRAMGDEMWYQQVEKYKPKGDYAKDTKAFLHNMHNKYYELLGCETSECREELENLKNVPRQLSEVGGAWTSMNEKYNEAGGKKLFAPGSLNARTPNYIMQVMENGGTTKKVYNEKTGHVEFEVYDAKGGRVMELDKDGKKTSNPLMVDAVDFTKGALSGNVTVNTYGDPAGLRREFQAGIAKDMDYNDYVQKITDNTDQYNKKGYQDYTEANSLYKQNLEGSNAGALMDDKKLMTDNYPVIINGLFEQAKGGDQAALASLEKLDQQTGGKILGGDGLGGTNDLDLSSGLAVQSAIGMWDNSDIQREAADAYFKHYDESSNLLKPDRIDKTNVKSSITNAERRAQANFNKTQTKDIANLKAANNEKEFVTNFDNMFANAKSSDDIYKILQNDLGNFAMKNSNAGSGSILEFTGDEPKDRQFDIDDNGDGTFSIKLNKISKDPKTNEVTTGDAVRIYNTGNANDMSSLRRDFGINNKTYKLQGEAPSEQEEQATSATQQNNPLNAASFNKNNQPKPKPEAKSDFIPDPNVNYESLPMMDKRRVEYENWKQSQVPEELQDPVSKVKPTPEVKPAPEVKPEQVKSKAPQTSRDLKAENKKQEDLMRNSEVTYGGKSGDDTIGLTDYEDYDFKYYLNSEKQVQEGVDRNGEMATYWGGDQPKKGLKKDLGEKVYDGLSDGQQAMMRMQHVNIGWDPRVTMLLASGAIKPSERGEYLRNYKKTTTKYNDNKAKFKNIDDQAMFDQWVDLYANSEPNTKGLQKQYKRRVEDMAKSYGFKLTKEQLDLFKV